MNKLNEIFSTTFTEALGWTLFHSLWQGAIIAVFLYLLLSIFRQGQSRIRYFIAVSAQLSILTVAVITFMYQLNIAAPAAVDEKMPLYFLKSTHGAAAGDYAVGNASTFTLDYLLAVVQAQMPLFLMGWLAGVVIALCKLAGGYYYMKTKIGKAMNHCPDELKQLLSRLTNQMNFNRMVRICEVPFLNVPAVFGHLKPVILIPVGLVNHLTPQQVEMVILHELAHIKRNDFLINLLQSIMEALFFFNPTVWWISREIRQERENCCDDLIIEMHGQPLPYIKTLAAVNHFNVSGFKLLPGFFGNSKGQLLKRMQRLVGVKTGNSSPQGYKVVSLLVVLLSFFYFGWVNKHLTTPNQAVEHGSAYSTLLSEIPEPSQGFYKILPVPEADTVKDDDITREQAAKIKEQEQLIKELKAKIDALEARKSEDRRARAQRKEEVIRSSGEHPEEMLELKEEAKRQAERQLEKLQDPEIESVEKIGEMLENIIIEELPDFSRLNHLKDVEIELEIQEHLNIIREEILENINDVNISRLEDFEINISGLQALELNTESMKEMMQLQELKLKNFQIDLDEIMEDLKKDMKTFTDRIDRFKEQLFESLREDGIISDEVRSLKISMRDGQVIINGEKLSGQLSDKYRKMLEDEFGDISVENLDEDDFNMQFDLE